MTAHEHIRRIHERTESWIVWYDDYRGAEENEIDFNALLPEIADALEAADNACQRWTSENGIKLSHALARLTDKLAEGDRP